MTLKVNHCVILALGLGLAGCTTFQRGNGNTEASQLQVHHRTEVSSGDVQSQLRKPYKSPFGEVPLTDNQMTRMWIKYFTGRGRRHMDRYLARSSRYLPMMKNVLREEGLPEDLVYVALIESGFSPQAHSRANAVGYWQFIRGTGKRYGLRIDGYMDERSDPVLSTRAAAGYFKALYNLFGSWHLSLAAYNTGENRVKRRVMRYYTRDFWELARRRKLPRETRNYVPKYIAAAMIAKNPAKYGFTNIEYQKPLEYDAIEINRSISLKLLASRIGVTHGEIKRLNPKFRGDYVPTYGSKEKMMVRVPVGHRAQALAALPHVGMDKPQYVYRDYYYYRVRRGDTLSTIARRHRTRVSTLKRLNRMGRRSMIRIGQRLKVPERGGPRKYSVAISQKSSGPGPVVLSKTDYHKVRRGENLSVIAAKYGVSIHQLRELNQLGRRSMIRVGQKLRIRSTDSVTGKNKVVYHIVKAGENLSLIAAKYGVSVRDIQQLNSLGRRSLLRVGQRLKIKVKKVHVVKQGENLTLIAKKYRVTLRQLVTANRLKSRQLVAAGRSLVIPR